MVISVGHETEGEWGEGMCSIRPWYSRNFRLCKCKGLDLMCCCVFAHLLSSPLSNQRVRTNSHLSAYDLSTVPHIASRHSTVAARVPGSQLQPDPPTQSMCRESSIASSTSGKTTKEYQKGVFSREDPT